MVHNKSQQIDPFGVCLDLKFRTLPNQFHITRTELAHSVQVGPLWVWVLSPEHQRNNPFGSFKAPELSVRDYRYLLTVVRQLEMVTLCEIYPHHWHPQPVPIEIDLNHHVDNLIQVNTRVCVYLQILPWLSLRRNCLYFFIHLELEVACIVFIPQIDSYGLIGFVSDKKYDSDSVFGTDQGWFFEGQLKSVIFN